MKKIIFLVFVTSLTLFLLFRKDLSRSLQARTAEKRINEYSLRKYQNGDIIFHTSKSSQSKAVQLATNSKYSHMGIIYEENEELYVYEAVQPVKLTRLENWIKRGKDSYFVVKRLKESHRVLNTKNLIKLKKAGEKYKDKDYDLYFGWSDDKIYCSELVWKIYKEALNIELGKLQNLKEFNLTNELVKQKMEERYGNKIPLNEKVISPSAIFESEKLETVI